MSEYKSNYTITFTRDTKLAFLSHLHQNPNPRRVTQTAREDIIEWLTNPHKRPSTQKEFSRRHYIRKTFVWDEKTYNLLAPANKIGEQDRVVITEDSIADVVELVHEGNGHAGWDATWKDISSSYYGILRMDVIFLLKECQLCVHDPRKRPKGSAGVVPNTQSIDQGWDNLFDVDQTFLPSDSLEDQSSLDA